MIPPRQAYGIRGKLHCRAARAPPWTMDERPVSTTLAMRPASINRCIWHLNGFGPGGSSRTVSAAAVTPRTLAFDATGNAHPRVGVRVRRVDAGTGGIPTVAGMGSPADGVRDGLPAVQAWFAARITSPSPPPVTCSEAIAPTPGAQGFGPSRGCPSSSRRVAVANGARHETLDRDWDGRLRQHGSCRIEVSRRRG